MKNVRQLVSAAVLTLVISSVTIAGEMWTPGIDNPPPPTVGRDASSTSKVEVLALDSLTEIAVRLLTSMLAIFQEAPTH